MKKGKGKNKETSNKNTTENKPGTENSSPKQRKGLYYLLFKGGLWQ